MEFKIDDQTFHVGRLNSDSGKAFAKTLRKSALLEIADWCHHAKRYCEEGKDPAEQLDAGLYEDAEMTLRRIADHAA